MPDLEGIKHVLLDIEGTICPIYFVKETLFPYAIKALPDVLAAKWDDEAFRPYRDAFPEEARESPESLQAHAEDLTTRDVKIAYHKNLQGYLWEDGYKSGAYSTPLFKDVVPRLRKWKESGLDLAIYSSGSVFAQKLLFEHVSVGQDSNEVEDLRDLIVGWFDTTNAGPKTEGDSYSKIAEVQNWEAPTVLFLSDNVKEVEAATAAGMTAVLVERPGNAILADDDKARFTMIDTLEELSLSTLSTQPVDNTTKDKEAANGSALEAVEADTGSAVVEKSNPMPQKRKKTAGGSEPSKVPRRSSRLSSTAGGV